jgi:hypothetical protein
MMPLTIKYNGSERGWDELAVTGKPSVWNPGQQEERSDAEAALLIGTGLFSRVYTADSLASLNAEVAKNRTLIGEGLRAAIANPARPLGLQVVGNSFENSAALWTGCCAASNGALVLVKRNGYSGYRSDQVLAELVAGGLDPTADVLAFGEGTNDASQGITVAAHVANMRAIAQYALDRNVIPVMRLTPQTDAAYSATVNQYALADRMLAEQMGIPFVDNFTRWLDTDGTWTSGASGDTVHPYSGIYASAGADAWAQLSGTYPPLLPRSDAGDGMFGSNVLQLAHTGNLPTGDSLLGFTGHTINALTDYAHPFRGKMASITCNQSASADVYRSVSASGKFSVGDRVTISGVLGMASGSNMLVSAFVRAMGPNTDFNIAAVASNVDRYCRATFVVPEGTTSLRLFRRAQAATSGTYTGDIRWGGWDSYNVTTNTYAG